ncbi:phosphopantetheine binding protein [Lachnotalea glycerini]|uniref:Phosphopantetheine binding protein n=1 Tax=Lachnotalea glycerini TaxID=1763509 RepID=A0A318ETL4_9FIRM|nr:SDR family NAD(P)-dependent oxidoreductase [Lachnotalea glycerini]PXV95612.1 phosphopantetheine binding protein [Lachnotalea glycerini]
MNDKEPDVEKDGVILEKTYSVEWEERDTVPIKETEKSEYIILFDTKDEFRNCLMDQYKGNPSHIILIKQSDHYRKLDETTFEVAPGEKGDFIQLIEELKACHVQMNQIIYRWTKKRFQMDQMAIKNQLEEGFYSLLYLSQAMIKQKISYKIKLLYVFVAEEIEPLHEAVSGFCKTIHLEQPNYSYEIVKIQEDFALEENKIADFILQELNNPKEDTQVFFQGKSRFVPCIRDVDLQKPSTNPVRFQKNKTYLITGGTGGIGMIFARYLASEYQANLILSGSSVLNDRKQKQIDELVQMGANVKYIQANLSVEEEAAYLLRAAYGYFKKIDGILHCAGMIQDSLLLFKEKAEVEKVFGPKIYGTTYLMKQFINKPLDFIILFSGLASVAGNVGQIDYSYANAYLDHMSFYLKSELKCTRIISINWPLWENGGMNIDSQIKEQLREMTGLETIDNQYGILVVNNALQHDYSQIIVVRINSEKKEVIQSMMQEERRDNIPNKNPIPLESKSQLKRQMEEYLKQILSNQLGIPIAKIKLSEPWEQYGIDSMSIVRMTNEMEKKFKELSKTLFFEYLNINELSDFFVENYADIIQKELVATGEKAETTDLLEQKKRTKENNRFITKKEDSKKEERKEYVVSQNRTDTDIAIIGISGSYPEAENLEEYWENLKAGKDCITEIPLKRWDYHKYESEKKDEKGNIYAKWGGFLKNYDKFDPMFFGITPKNAEQMDPQERLFLETAFHALEDAGYNFDELSHHEVGVYVGVMYGHYELFASQELERGNAMALSSSFSSIANRVSYTFHLTGPSIAVDTMCSSSLTSVHLACQSIRDGECDMAVAGGVNLSIHPSKYLYLCENNFASSDGRCHSFGEGGDGYVPGEGVGAVILKSLKQAEADHDHIYAVIKASTINHGGRTNGYTVPNPNKQADLIIKALKKADITPRAISYIEAHGTGTSLGDPIEITGLTKAYTQFTKDKQYCAIGSVKSNIGHLESAAGIAAITKIILQMQHKQLVPSIHCEVLNQNISFKSTPFYVQKSLSDWKQPIVTRQGKTVEFPRIAAISAFGAGGSNAHMIVKEYSEKNKEKEILNNSQQVILLSARNQNKLKECAKRLLEYLDKNRTIGWNQTIKPADRIEKVRAFLIESVAFLKHISITELDTESSLDEMNFSLVEWSNLAEKINEEWKIGLSVENLLEHFSINEMAEFICSESSEEMNRGQIGDEQNKKSYTAFKLEQIAYTLQVGREEKEERAAFVVTTWEELEQALKYYLEDKANEFTYFGKKSINQIEDNQESGEQQIEQCLQNKDMKQLAKLWVSGSKIDWNQLYFKQKPRRISLPGYPFERKRYWYDSYEKKSETKEEPLVRKEQKPLLDQTNNYLTAGYEDAIKNYHGDEVLVQIVEDSIAIISMQDKKHRNMFHEDLVIGLMAKFQEVSQNQTIKAIILTGYENIFSMGGTQEQLLEISNKERRFTDAPFLYRGLLECPIPVIAAIQGHASGGGLLFGLYSDMVVMSNEGIYTAVFMKYGFTPGMGATYILEKRFGETLATEMMFTAKSFTGEELAKRGAPVIVKKREEVLMEAMRIAKLLSEKSKLSLTTLKKELAGRMLEQLPKYIEREDIMHDKTFTTQEVKERIRHYYLDGHEFGENQNSVSKTVNEEPQPLNEMLDALESGNMSPDEAKQFCLNNIKF